MFKKNFKLIFLAFFCLIAVFSSCIVEPPDLDSFLTRDDVLEIIREQEERRDQRVTLIDRTEDSLAAGYRRITGLNPGRFYMVEALNEKGDVINAGFVGPDGLILQELGKIGHVTGRAILGLNNNHTYIVYAAAPLFEDNTIFEYFDLAYEGGPFPPNLPSTTVTANDGLVILNAPKGFLYINLAPVISPNETYELMRVPIIEPDNGDVWLDSRVSAYFNGTGPAPALLPTSTYFERPAGMDNNSIGIFQFLASPEPGYLYNMSILPVQGAGTINDYVFVKRNTDGEILGFYTLRVIVKNAGG